MSVGTRVDERGSSSKALQVLLWYWSLTVGPIAHGEPMGLRLALRDFT